MRRLAPLALILLLLPACPGGEDEPADVVKGFIDALDEGDWEGATSRLSAEALAQLPADEAQLIPLKHRILGMTKGRIDHEVVETRVDGDDRASVVTKVSVRLAAASLAKPVSRTVTFGLVREKGVWKLLPAVTLPSGKVVENPLMLLSLSLPKIIREASGGEPPAEGE
jgi:hypothetical protein